MAIIECSALNCVYNKSNTCRKRQINIIGIRAKKSDDTECINFLSGNNTTFDFEIAGMDNRLMNTSLNCTVSGCIHNKKYICQKESIKVSGYKINKNDMTCCNSFEE